MGIKVGVQKTVEVEAKTLRIYTKITDRFQAYILDQDGVKIGGQDDGYVPSLMPGDHYGDYIILDIDLESGRVTNWTKPSPEQIRAFVTGDDA
jgi:hypothetical protein